MLHNFKTAEETEDLSYFCINWFRRMQTRGWLPWTSKHDFSGNNSSGQFTSGKKPCSVPFLDPGCQWEQGSFLLFFSFSVFLLGLADSCLANNSRLHSDEGSKLLMDKIVVLHNLENLACKFYPGLKQIQAWQRYACFWSELFPIFSSSSRCCVNSKKHKSLESWKKKIFYFYFHQRYNMYCICKLQKKRLRNSMCWIQLLTNVTHWNKNAVKSQM